MPSDTPRLRLLVAVVTVALLVSGVAAAVATGARDGGASVTPTAPTPTAGGDGSAPVESGRESGPADGNEAPAEHSNDETTTGQTTDVGDKARGEPAAQRQLATTSPPLPGTYVYSWSRQDGAESDSGERRTVVVDDGTTDGDHSQLVKHGSGGGSATNEVTWRRDGAYVTATTYVTGPVKQRCDWDTAVKELALPLDIGAEWSYAASCTATFGGEPMTIDRKGDFEVVGVDRVTVGGEAIDTWKLESVEEFAFSTSDRMRHETTAFFSPRHGLVVKSVNRTTSNGDSESTSVVEVEIKNLSPR